MQGATGRGNNGNPMAAPFARHGHRTMRKRFHYAFNFLIIISIVLYSSDTLSEKTSNIRSVQIELGNGNRICMSLEGDIRGIIVNGSVNLPGETFENITRVGNTQISRSHSGMLTRIGHVGIHRNWRGSIVKIGSARILRDKQGSVIAVNGDPDVSPLYTIAHRDMQRQRY